MRSRFSYVLFVLRLLLLILVFLHRARFATNDYVQNCFVRIIFITCDPQREYNDNATNYRVLWRRLSLLNAVGNITNWPLVWLACKILLSMTRNRHRHHNCDRLKTTAQHKNRNVPLNWQWPAEWNRHTARSHQDDPRIFQLHWAIWKANRWTCRPLPIWFYW